MTAGANSDSVMAAMGGSMHRLAATAYTSVDSTTRFHAGRVYPAELCMGDLNQVSRPVVDQRAATRVTESTEGYDTVVQPDRLRWV